MGKIKSFYESDSAVCALMRSRAVVSLSAHGGMQMTIARWNPPVAPTRREQFLLKRLGRVRKLFGLLRVHRHESFNDACQDELASMMIELRVVDLRVQMVLGCLGSEAPACSQGALQEFRERLIAADLD